MWNDRFVKETVVVAGGKDGYRLFTDNLSDPFVRCRVIRDNRGETVDLIFLEANPAFADMTGCTQSEMIGKSFIPLIHPDDMEKSLVSGSNFPNLPHRAQLEQRMLTVNGWRWFQWENIAIGSADGNIVELCCLGRDITELKEVKQNIAAEALKWAEKRSHDILDSLEEAYCEADLSGKITLCNQYVAQLLGYNRDEFIGRDYRHFFTKRKIVVQAVAEMRRSGRSQRLSPLEILGRNGGIIYGDFSFAPLKDNNGSMVGVRVSGRDITARKRAEDALQNACRRLDEIIDFLPDATFVIDNNGIVVAWNKAIEEVTGVSRADMLGKGNYEYALTVYGERRPVLIDLLQMPEAEFDEHKQTYESIEWKGSKLYGRIYAPGHTTAKGPIFGQ